MIINYNVTRVEPTLDGPKEIHDKRRIATDGSETFDKIVEGVDCLLDHNINVTVRTNVDKENINTLPVGKNI